MELFLLRHAVPVEENAWTGPDRTRPLTEAGEKELRRVLAALRSSRSFAAELILCSPYARTVETARIASGILGAPFEILPALASGASPESILRACGERELPEKALLVGHSPDLGLLASHLTGAPGLYSFARSGSAGLEGPLLPGAMSLRWLVTPSEALRALHELS